MTALVSTRAAVCSLVVLVGWLSPLTGSAHLICDPCTVGVVLDGPWKRNDEVRGTFEREVLGVVPVLYALFFRVGFRTFVY